MVKFGLMHAMLIDMTMQPDPHRRPRIADAFVQAISPHDTGMVLLRFMDHLGMLDEEQRQWLRDAERAEDEDRL